MEICTAKTEVEQFKASPPKFECTFETPLKDLPRFVATILTPFPVDAAKIITEVVVFEPEHLLKELESRGITFNNDCRDKAITATSAEEVASLLTAMLADWIDFLFIPSGGQFAIFADHDEYTTIFSDDESSLREITALLSQFDFKVVHSWRRFERA